MSRVTFSIMYAGLQLTIVKNERGEDVTPLKPIADLFGLSWTDQHRKITGSTYLREYLGICMGEIPHVGGQKREQTCILLSRVAAYLMSINPEKVGAQGNIDGAKFLIGKQEEWADALHDYEELGVAVNLKHLNVQKVLRAQRGQFLQSINVLNKTSNPACRKAIAAVMGQMADELGVPLQLDMIDSTGSGTAST